MNYSEEAFVFECHGASLVAIATEPAQRTCSAGLLVVVGGPQYRVGSHRQFVQLSRALARQGIACLRFDCRGMGDSDGRSRDFTDIHEDIAAAVDAFCDRNPELTDIVLWGLCDGATAAAFYAPEDTRVSGLILLNPWVHTQEGEARAYLRHYYWRRATSSAFWRKLFAGDFSLRRSLRDASQLVQRAFPRTPTSDGSHSQEDLSLPRLLHQKLTQRPVKTLIFLSQRDLVAQEFDSLINSDDDWSRFSETATIERFADADHTFSDPHDAGRAVQLTVDWIMRA
jgi:exosortase A-associated hydrolase 1